MYDQEKFEENYDRFDPENVVGRYVRNFWGRQEWVTMRQYFWDYMDWVDQTERGFESTRYGWDREIHSRQFINLCGQMQRNPRIDFGKCLENWIDMEARFRRSQKLPEPEWMKHVELGI
jgi:hypothetical protein